MSLAEMRSSLPQSRRRRDSSLIRGSRCRAALTVTGINHQATRLATRSRTAAARCEPTPSVSLRSTAPPARQGSRLERAQRHNRRCNACGIGATEGEGVQKYVEPSDVPMTLHCIVYSMVLRVPPHECCSFSILLCSPTMTHRLPMSMAYLVEPTSPECWSRSLDAWVASGPL